MGVIFGAEMTQIAWRARMVGSARCADRTPQRGVPIVVLTRIDFERLTTDVISSVVKHLWLFPVGESLQKRSEMESLASRTLSAALQLLPRLRDQNDSYEAAGSKPNDKRQDQ